ncbi:MAG: HupE/UreJ family protein [Alphaproteobacteria bacterium]|nr:HupE/UreJ family protein [Alphaproteobacteria bacterium]
MSSQRFILLTMVLFILGALPLLIAQPTALASAGLSLGFSAPLEHAPLLLLITLVGVAAALLPRDGLLLMPIAFTLMIMVGGALSLDVMHDPFLRYFILGAILCIGLLVGIAREKLTVLMLLILASLGFHLGGFFMQTLPAIATPMYYLLGVLLSLGMVLAIAVAFGVTLFGDNEATWERMKKSPRVALIRRIFL